MESRKGNKVTLFKDDCRDPKEILPNGEPWIFKAFGSCDPPYLYAEPNTFFNVRKIQTDEKYVQGWPMTVTVFYECTGECATGDTESATFDLLTPIKP